MSLFVPFLFAQLILYYRSHCYRFAPFCAMMQSCKGGVSMDWNIYYDRFYEWEESTQLRHLSSLTSFGPSSEVYELAYAFMEEKSANRLIRKALSAGVRFSADEVMELDGVVDISLMPQLIKNISHPLTAEQLDAFTFWLSAKDVRTLANKHHIRLDEDGNVMTDDMVEAEREMELELQEFERTKKKDASKAKENLLLAKLILAIHRKNRRKRRKM